MWHMAISKLHNNNINWYNTLYTQTKILLFLTFEYNIDKIIIVKHKINII